MLITISLEIPGSKEVLKRLQSGPIPMSANVASCSADIKELVNKGFAVYDRASGQLKLPRDM